MECESKSEFERAYKNLLRLLVPAMAALSATLAMATAAPEAYATQSNPTTNDCNTTLQSEVDSIAAGGVVALKPCVYRSSAIIYADNVTILGQSGTEIRGSDNWSSDNWRKRKRPRGTTYVSTKTVPKLPVVSGQCKASAPNCNLPEQVFFDGKELTQVASGIRPVSGQFTLDSSRHVVLGDNPSGHLVEVTTRPYWIIGSYTASSVTISNITASHAGGNEAGIHNRSGGKTGWTIKNSDLSYAASRMIDLNLTGNIVSDNNLHHGGKLGISSYASELTFSGNHIYENNTQGFDPNYEAGGVKMLKMQNVIGRANTVYSNDGWGLWCDTYCDRIELGFNTLHHNQMGGILQEASYGTANSAKIHDNDLWENGWRYSGAAIALSNAANTEVYGNTLAWNESGIKTTRMDRQDPSIANVVNVYIHDNVICSRDYVTMAQDSSNTRRGQAVSWFDWLDGSGLYSSASNNAGANNSYYYPTLEDPNYGRFKWVGWTHSIATYNATPAEESGRYLSAAEKDSLLSSKDIPTNPEH